ncbi:hypothetical protein M1146_08270 [Patescibacteria group bacterium]|nr:hypothetical protein [Patescibacteria group bacterium]
MIEKSTKDKIMRVNSQFEREVRAMQMSRIQLGKDRPPRITTPNRITLAITRHKDFQKIKRDIETADLK